jgi:leader peptidase (prepilin peptidase)/N-methyltransferase
LITALCIVSVLGASLGSFLEVCIDRVPRGISITSVRSQCSHCQTVLRWFELIPILSFLIQKGKCRSCNFQISREHLLLELLCLLLSVSFFLVLGITGKFIYCLTFSFIVLPIIIIDWKHYIIPNVILVAGCVVGVVLFAFIEPASLPRKFVSMLVCFIQLLIIRYAGNTFFHRETMGIGDVKLAGFLGLFLGFENFLITLWLSSILGILYGLITSIGTTGSWKIKIPFGAFLGVSAILVLIFADPLDQVINAWMSVAL